MWNLAESCTALIICCCANEFLAQKTAFAFFNLLQIHQSTVPRDITVVKSLHSGGTQKPWAMQFNSQEMLLHEMSGFKQENKEVFNLLMLYMSANTSAL